jgi:hypothetical protein
MEQLEHSEPPTATQTRLGGIRSKMSGVVTRFHRLDSFMSSSTFGRIFRLRGCGHVCIYPNSYLLFIYPAMLSKHINNVLTKHKPTARRNTKCNILQGGQGWNDHICNNGIHHSCQCKLVPTIYSKSSITNFNLFPGHNPLPDRWHLRMR